MRRTIIKLSAHLGVLGVSAFKKSLETYDNIIFVKITGVVFKVDS